ncbi:uncharacterized protein LTR77_006273 [Saxophila tyrrhenica]|uniref:Peptidase C15, pyroglutamyl peptidase I-like protein n=1 Tax=Saxophila tyrrhenica TaxID=1690608 RepID=A0AAV9PAG4_9PEZI|nr:hypothetical protein LTR77_006273 [Saxophila tyrrhenica]
MGFQPAANGMATEPLVPSNDGERPLTVLVTGFGPFQDRFPVNPSYEILKLLPSTFTCLSGEKEIQIIAYHHPIRVSYEEVRRLVPVIHASYPQGVDLILHIGMASGRTFYTAERSAHRDGYEKNKDVDGQTLAADHGQTFFGDCDPILRTSLDYERVLQRWKWNLQNVPESSAAYGADCRGSDDAGHYLCDYIYFNSLAWLARNPTPRADGAANERPVMFLHVPAESDPRMLYKGKEVALALIEAMVESWIESTDAEMV